MLNIYELALLLPVLLLLAWWWRSSGQKGVAVSAARSYCKERGLQMLDETLVFRRFRVETDARGRKRLCRIYEFDYSEAGEDRQSGEIIVSSYTVLRVILHSSALEITDFQR